MINLVGDYTLGHFQQSWEQKGEGVSIAPHGWV